MALTQEQTQMLMAYMQKNRNIPQAAQAAPVQLPAQSNGGASAGISSLLSSAGKLFDTAPMQGPVQPGAAPLDNGQSWLSKFADRIDPAAAMQRQQITQQQAAPQIDMKAVMAALAKAGIR